MRWLTKAIVPSRRRRAGAQLVEAVERDDRRAQRASASRRCRRAPRSASGLIDRPHDARPLGARAPSAEPGRSRGARRRVRRRASARRPTPIASVERRRARDASAVPIDQLGQPLPRDVGRCGPRSRRCARPPGSRPRRARAAAPGPPGPGAAQPAHVASTMATPHARSARLTGSSSRRAGCAASRSANHRHAG